MTLTDPESARLTQELLRTAKFCSVGAVELQIRQRIRELRDEQQQELLKLVDGGHKRPEETLTNKIFEAKINELEDVVSSIDFYKESLFVDVDIDVDEESEVA